MVLSSTTSQVSCIIITRGIALSRDHLSDIPREDSIEPAYQTLKPIITDMGFTITEEREKVETSYSQNPNSMLQYTYNCVMFTAKKE